MIYDYLLNRRIIRCESVKSVATVVLENTEHKTGVPYYLLLCAKNNGRAHNQKYLLIFIYHDSYIWIPIPMVCNFPILRFHFSSYAGSNFLMRYFFWKICGNIVSSFFLSEQSQKNTRATWKIIFRQNRNLISWNIIYINEYMFERYTYFEKKQQQNVSQKYS